MIKTSNSITTLSFECADRLDWLKDIAEMCSALQAGNIADNVIFRFDNHSDIEKIKPVHVTSLACLIEALVAPSRSIKLHRRQDPIGEYLWTNLKFREYWAGGKNFVEASDNSIFNLWRLRNEEKEIIPIRVHDYFKKRYFGHKDLSSIKNSLDEAYYNVFDHADANGNAFSFIQYDSNRQILYIAVCDFGKGIPTTVRNFKPDILTDEDALRLAMQDQFTVKSQEHNSGTALFYNLSLSKFEEEEIINNFELE